MIYLIAAVVTAALIEWDPAHRSPIRLHTAIAILVRRGWLYQIKKGRKVMRTCAMCGAPATRKITSVTMSVDTTLQTNVTLWCEAHARTVESGLRRKKGAGYGGAWRVEVVSS